MTMLADAADGVIGVDTHTDTHTACLLDRLGRHLATITVPADLRGCAMLLAWAREQAPGPRLVWAVEGCRRSCKCPSLRVWQRLRWWTLKQTRLPAWQDLIRPGA